MKKILFIVLIIITAFFIYLGLQDKKIYYLVLGDEVSKEKYIGDNYYDFNSQLSNYLNDQNLLEKYINYSKEGMRVTDLINDINKNVDIDNKKIKNLLIKSDILLLSIGYDDIINKYNKYYSYQINDINNSFLNDLEELFILVRKYCKEDIIMLSYYNIFDDDTYSSYIINLNQEVKKLSEKYNIHFCDISKLSKYKDQNLPNVEGNYIIYKNIRKIIEESVLN